MNLSIQFQKLEKLFHEASFKPCFLGLLYNPAFILRAELFKAVRSLGKNAEGNLLDFGCGSQPYRKLFDKVKTYTGCDIQESGHTHLFSKIDYFYDGKKLPFPDKEYDWVVAFETFEHIFNLDEILQEIHRVTKPNGHLLLSAPFCWNEHEVPYDFARYTSYGLKYLLEKNGFKVVRALKTGSYFLSISQMFIEYLSQLLPRRRVFRIFLYPFLIMPLTLAAYSINFILPKNNDFFLNNVILCQKSTASF